MMLFGLVSESIGPTLAQSLVVYQWLRIEQLDQWWHWILLIGVCLLVLAYVVLWYRRDASEHHRPVGWALMLLRVSALVGLLLFFLQLDKRTEQRVVRDSRVAVLVDTSMSMSLPGTPSKVGVSSSISRSEEILRLVGQSDFLRELAKEHQVAVYRFDQESRPAAVAALNKQFNESVEADSTMAGLSSETLRKSRISTASACVLGGIACVLLCVAWGGQLAGARDWLAGSWVLFAGSTSYLVSMVILAWALVHSSDYPLAALFGMESRPLSEAVDESQDESSDVLANLPEDWHSVLAPQGIESRLGEAIKSILDRELGSPLAGIVVLTDGRSNAGIAPREVLTVSQNARVPLFMIGVGAAESPANLELVEVDLPKRLYPGDRFALRALIGGTGPAGQLATVQVLSGPSDSEVEDMSIEEEATVEISGDGSMVTADFDLRPKAVGNWRYRVQILPRGEDANQSDNAQSTEVQVVERKNRVLLLAGGPTREYQFVRNLLYRDRDVESHVLLQSGTDKSSQESQELLTEFPVDRAALSQYDAVLAFDADWTAISESSVRALEQWVAEQAGGFLLVAGSVEMPKWLARSADGPKTRTLRSLSPVVLEKRGSALLAVGRIEAESAWPLTLTSDGAQSEFLWVTDQQKSSLQVWQDFVGVYSFNAAYELKPGAKAQLSFSDPTAAMDGQQPIYMATHFYGAGRCAYLGGGELWRMRQAGDQYFDRFYTKLVRWISQGRLLLDSDRGVLLVDREQALLGDQVILRAVLKNERYEPLIQSEVVARLIDPRQSNVPIVLRPLADGSQPGVYTGQFPILMPGEYVAQLQIGGLASNELFSVRVKAKVPALEMQRAERNDPLLRQLAVESGGKYWIGIEDAVKPLDDGGIDILRSIEPQDQVAYLPGTPDQRFQLRWLAWLMAWIAGCLSLEWLTRRLHRLA